MIDQNFLPLKVSVYLTNHCHYHCKYCFFEEHHQLNTEHLSEKNIQRFLSFMKQYEVPLISICGGDPLVHAGFLDFAHQLSSSGNYAIVSTNAVNISKEYLVAVKKSGIRYLQIGVDRVSNRFIDNYKEDGHIEKILQSIRWMQEVGLSYGFAACITRENIAYLDELVNFSKLQSADLLKVSLYDGMNPQFQISDSQLDQLINKIDDLNKKNDNYIKGSFIKQSLQFESLYPSLTIYTDGTLAIEETGEILGNIGKSDPGKLYRDYINGRD
ncbi:radical SAM protein [Enterococcus faecium]|uniref:radical SAM protein n=1 Tax=Enterococcus faecium TaxID=1352 RepID=UPI0019DEBD18|nr:radical SAM protein [Enterococcus faecium]